MDSGRTHGNPFAMLRNIQPHDALLRLLVVPGILPHLDALLQECNSLLELRGNFLRLLRRTLTTHTHTHTHTHNGTTCEHVSHSHSHSHSLRTRCC